MNIFFNIHDASTSDPHHDAGVTFLGAIPVGLIVRDSRIISAFSTACVAFMLIFGALIGLFAFLPAPLQQGMVQQSPLLQLVLVCCVACVARMLIFGALVSRFAFLSTPVQQGWSLLSGSTLLEILLWDVLLCYLWGLFAGCLLPYSRLCNK